MSAFFFAVPLLLAVLMGCAWAVAALWNHITDAPRGVPVPPRRPVSVLIVVGAFLIAAIVVLACASVLESQALAKRNSAISSIINARNESNGTDAELAAAETALLDANTDGEKSRAETKVRNAQIRISQSKRHIEEAESFFRLTESRYPAGTAQTLSFAIVAILLVGAIVFALVERGAPPGAPPPGATAPQPMPVHGDARWSRSAVWGAALAAGSIPFGLILFLIVKTILNPSIESSSQLNGPVLGNIILFGFIPAFIGIALGWKAVSDIRHHRDHLRGGGTATFAAIGIPTLALNFTVLVNFADIARFGQRGGATTIGLIVACLVVLAAIASSVWAVRAVWRAVHDGPPGVPVRPRTQNPAATPAMHTPPFELISPRQWLGMPLYHIVRAKNPATGKHPVARGVFAIGVRAHGIFAVGVIASGGVTLGVISFGIFSVGVLAVGLLAGGINAAGLLAGGVNALGVFSAIGVNAFGDIAKGVNAFGRYYAEGANIRRLENLTFIFAGAFAFAVAIFASVLPSLLNLHRADTTGAGRPWSAANFRGILAVIGILALGSIHFALPSLPTFQTPRAEPPKFAISYKSDITRPDTVGVALETALPYGWVVDFSFFIRDAEGSTEVPRLSCTIAASTPPPPENLKGKPIIPIEGGWTMEPPQSPGATPLIRYRLNPKLPIKSGWWRNADGAFPIPERFAGWSWELHPNRPASSLLTDGAIVPFLRGLSGGGTPSAGAEMFIRIEARPMRDGENASRLRVLDNAVQEKRHAQLRSHERVKPGDGYERIEAPTKQP